MTTTAPTPTATELQEHLDEERWQTVLARDAQANGAFVYAVRSTGIYCRPSCPSRRPARRQVTFFSVPEAAEQAGFRPCLRCLPRQHPPVEPQLEMVRQVCQIIQESPDTPVSLTQLGETVGVSPYHLQRVFKRVMGISPRQYADARRLAQLKEGLKEGQRVSDALYDAGYGSSSRLYGQASHSLGMTPGSYRRRGAGVELAYTVAECPLGRLLVAATERGVCSVSLADDEAELAAGLRREYSAATIHRDDARLGQWVHAILEHLAGRMPHIDIPLDIRATAFQRLVWEELQRIPYGKTRSYSEIARAIQQPRAARAVARACSSNPTALVVPCHRVVREDGGLGGYRWGIKRKEELLRQERANQETTSICPSGLAASSAEKS